MKNIRHNPAVQEPIAIVGMSCRFPGGVDSPQRYWELLRDGVDAITEIPADRWDKEALFSEDRSRPGKTYIRWGGFLDGIDQFDPEFFGISPREASHIDPQQRLLLEVAYEALEHAGCSLESLRGSRTGVYVGMFIHDYAHIQLHERESIDAYTGTGTSMSIAANRISYLFDLKGPSIAMDTACSSSLVALHQACESLRSGECNLVLAGGVNAILRPEMTVAMSKASMLSPDGRCHSFDQGANGYVRAEGAGMVTLKRLSDAKRDGDIIHAVIRSTALNQDGRTNGISVPNGHAQEALVREAHTLAGVTSAQIQYVEAHGTGTPVGDPIEANALGRVLSEGRAEDDRCFIGSVKSNIGHTESASGIAGLLKVVLALKHRQIPANLHFEKANPAIDLDALKLTVPINLEPWPRVEGPRLACLNSFGFGGTNAHAVVEEAPSGSTSGGTRESHHPLNSARLIPLSAHTSEALSALGSDLESYLSARRESTASGTPDEGEANYFLMDDLAYTCGQRRSHHPARLAMVASSTSELQETLTALSEGEVRAGVTALVKRLPHADRPVFVFSGMGPQWWAMGRELLSEEPVFRQAVEEIDAIFRDIAGWSILEELTRSEETSRIQETRVAQPAIFAVQIGLFRLWASLGVKPSAIAGHSVGEAAASYCAGILTLEDAVRVVFNRSRLQHRTEGQGRMLAVGLSEAGAREAIKGRQDLVSVAAINSPSSISLAGDTQELSRIEAELTSAGTFARFLQVPVPYHSPQMDPLREELLESLKGVRPQAGTTPYYSTILGHLVSGDELGAAYWWRNVRDTVLFAAAMDKMIADEFDTYLELGPHPVLARSIIECTEGHPGVALASLKRNQPEKAGVLATLGALFCHGYPVDFSLSSPYGQLLELPTFPWQRQRYWDESKESEARRRGMDVGLVASEGGPRHPLLGTKLSLIEPTFQNRLSEIDYVVDHRVRGGVVFPGAGYLEMATAAARKLYGDLSCTLSDVRFDAALFWPKNETIDLETTINRGYFEVHSRGESSKTWTSHMSGLLAPLRPEAESGDSIEVQAESLSIEGLKKRLNEEIEGDLVYPLLTEFGLNYGPAFQGIKTVWRTRGEALSLIEAPKSIVSSLNDHAFHPALLDACLHTLFCTLTIDGEDADMRGDVYLPVSIRRFEIRKAASSRLYAHCTLSERSGARSFEGDIRIYDEGGELVAAAVGLRCQNLAASDEAIPEKLSSWLYEYQWEHSPLLNERDLIEADEEPVWLLYADARGVSQRVAELLVRQGGRVVTVSQGEAFVVAGNDRFELNLTKAEQAEELLTHLEDANIVGVVYLAGLDAPADEDLEVDQVRQSYVSTYGGALSIIQALRIREGRQAELYFVTSGVFGVVEDDVILHPLQAPLWGLSRVLGNEQPELRPRCIDLSPELVPSELDALATEILAKSDEDEVALRGTRRFVHRFSPAVRQGLLTDQVTSIRYHLESTRKGSFDALAWQQLPERELAPGEVEIEVAAVGLNFKDVMKASGLLPASVMNGNFWQRALGMECSGTVRQVGSAVQQLQPGDEVFGFAHHALASHVVVDARLVTKKPSHLSHVEAATIPLAFATAYYALHSQAHLKEGETVLIHVATGGVGQAAMMLAKRAGARVFATAGSPKKRQFLQDAGAELVMDSRSLLFADEIRQKTAGRGVDVILNSLAGDAIDRNLDCLSNYGRFLELGKVDIDRNHRLGMRVLDRNASLHGIDLDRLLAERPEVAALLLAELAELFQRKELTHLPAQTFGADSVEEAFRFMAGAQHIGKIVLDLSEPPKAISRVGMVSFSTESTYLLTGGFGGFGLELIDWMISRGARHLTVLSRSGPTSEEAQAAVQRWTNQGVSIADERLDMRDESALARVIADLSQGAHPLRGVFHAAAILDDDLLRKQSLERFEKVAGSKLEGAWLLHQLTKTLPLECFVLFSSVTAVLGNHGSANYVAANAYVDSLAHARSRQGLPALVVNWGLIANVGMAQKEPEIRRHLEANGLVALHTRLGLAQLGVELERGTTQVTISPVNWERWLKFHQKGSSPRFSRLSASSRVASNEGDSKRDTAFAEILGKATAEERLGVIFGAIRERVARIFGTAQEKVDGDKRFTDLGLDSLMALELRGRLEEVGLTVTVSALLEGSSVRGLAERRCAEIEQEGGAIQNETLRGKESEAPRNLSVSEPPASEQGEGLWIVTPQRKKAAALRLFCFPYAGGAPTAFHDWGEELPEDFEVSAINLPGRGRRISEPARGSIGQMADEIVAEMRPLLDGPFAFFGHCMGAIIMYEVALRLQGVHGLSPVRLFAGGAMAPHLYQSPLVHSQSDPKFMDIMRLLDFTNTQAMLDDSEMRALLMPTLRADFEAVVNYGRDFTRRELLSSPVTAFAAKKDLFAAPSSVAFWKDYTSADFSLWMLDVHHYFVETHRTLLLRQVAADLALDLGRADLAQTRAALAQMSGMAQRGDLSNEADTVHHEKLDASTWISNHPSRREQKIKLYCFPSALDRRPGTAFLEGSVAQHAAVCLIDTPKWEGKRPSFVNQAKAIARTLVDDSDGPFAFFGHCSGAILAYEVAQALRDLGHPEPSRLFVSSSAAPDLYVMPNVNLLGDEKTTDVLDVIGHPLTEELRSNFALRASMMKTMRSDFEMMASYQYSKRPPLNCPITALRAENDLWTFYYGTESWAEHTHGGFELHTNRTGDHFHVEKDPASTIDLICQDLGWGRGSGVHRVAKLVHSSDAEVEEAADG